MKLAEYLCERLRQLGVGAVHGVPGEYNLRLLDYIQSSGLLWVGNTNELNAAYSADGYSRIKGVGALVTTFGAGELSAINGIAGAYAERAPVIHIVGIPMRAAREQRLLIHHTLNDGNYDRFSRMHSDVTIAQARLWDLRTSTRQIDYVLMQCLHHSRPVYIEIPTDLIEAEVPDGSIQSSLEPAIIASTSASDDLVGKILDKIYDAKQPVILVDGESRPMGIVKQVEKLLDLTTWPTWSTAFGKGLLEDESWPNFHGIYAGSYDVQKTQDFFNSADLILVFGPLYNDSNTSLYSSIPKASVAISFSDTDICVLGESFRDFSSGYVLSSLLEKLDLAKIHHYQPYPTLHRDHALSYSDLGDLQDAKISHDRLWKVLANFLQPGDIVLGDTGCPGLGVREIPLPKHCRFFNPVTWLSVGCMLPAAQGAALAQRELIASSDYHGLKKARTVLFIGDGAFQMTIQELSTIIHHNLDVVVFIINNGGFTAERCLHNKSATYHDVHAWNYLQAPKLFGAGDDAYAATVKTWKELEVILSNKKLAHGSGLRMVELILDRDDAPAGPLLQMMQMQEGHNGQDGFVENAGLR